MLYIKSWWYTFTYIYEFQRGTPCTLISSYNTYEPIKYYILIAFFNYSLQLNNGLIRMLNLSI
jgi:hypothetical protein